MREDFYPEVTGIVAGRWFRLGLGVTGKQRPIIRTGHFFANGYFAIRLWPRTSDSWGPGFYRILIFQTRPRRGHDRRLRFSA